MADELIREVDIKHYFPKVVAPSLEFRELAKIEDAEFALVWPKARKWFVNTYVNLLDVEGAERWESMLGITPADTDTLSQRRDAILAKINTTLPYTERSFQNMLDATYGEGQVTEQLNINDYELWLDLAATAMSQNASARRLARMIAPANLGIKVSNTKSVTHKLYIGGFIQMVHRTTINAGKDPHLTGDYSLRHYAAGVIHTYKHITIGGVGG